MKQYDHAKIEKKWQTEWEKSQIYRAQEEGGREKSYILDMFPYPSGEGLHVGHPKGYIATDVYSRWSRMNGKSVLHPIGWDAFGLPAENYALKNKTHPRKAVEKNVARFKEQLKLIGLDYDWSREINTTDPEYYRWTQWIFLKLFEKGLAYQSHEPINWCPMCQTGLANEDLEGGACERCGTPVEKKPMRQWVLRITDYAERLLNDLTLLPGWQEHIQESQRNWIGKSEGAEIDFPLTGGGEIITVFTTRPDTLFGATYLVLAPEHPFAVHYSTSQTCGDRGEVEAYLKQARERTDIERTAEGKEKSGVELKGVKAVNPATGEDIPVWVADYVLGHYGTGAIMAVPAHDERDFAFAKKFDLPIRPVVIPRIVDSDNPHREGKKTVFRRAIVGIVRDPKTDTYLVLKWKQQPWTTFVTGGIEEGEDAETAARREIAEETGYKDLRMVRVLGAPIQAEFFAAHKDFNRVAHVTAVLFDLTSNQRELVSEEELSKHETVWIERKHITPETMRYAELPVIMRRIETGSDAYSGDGILVNSEEFDGMSVAEAKKAITGKYGRAKVTWRLRDWVFSRQRYWGEPIPIIHCGKCGAVPVPYEQLPVRLPEIEKYEPTGTGESPLASMPEWVNTTCPKCGGAGKRETNTMPQWAGSSWYYLRYMDPRNEAALVSAEKEKHWAPVDLYVGGAEHATRHLIYARFWHKFLFDIGVVSTPEPFTRLISVGLIMAEDGRKMSKRYGNVINPDDIVATCGADTLRVYEMFMGPFTDAIAWNTNSMIGARRFLERVWRLSEKVAEQGTESTERELNKAIRKVGNDIQQFKFNTAISALMIFLNAAEKDVLGKDQFARFLQLLAPFAPHMAEELWHVLGKKDSIHVSPWPQHDERLLASERVTVVVQIDGKTRGEVSLESGASDAEVESAAREALAGKLEGKTIARVVVVPNRLVNFVTLK